MTKVTRVSKARGRFVRLKQRSLLMFFITYEKLYCFSSGEDGGKPSPVNIRDLPPTFMLEEKPEDSCSQLQPIDVQEPRQKTHPKQDHDERARTADQ